MTVRLTEKASQSAGSAGNGVPEGCTPRTMRSTSSAVTALARLAGRRTHAGGDATLEGDSCDVVRSPPVRGPRHISTSVYVTRIDVRRHTNYVSPQTAAG